MKTEARIKIKNKRFEILVDLDKALKLKNGEKVMISEIIEADAIFSDIKKGTRASETELKEAFGVSDIATVAEKIIRQGEVVLPAEYRNKEKDNILKQVIDFLSKNAIDPATNKPHTPARIEQALSQAGVNVSNRPMDEQMKAIVEALQKILPLKIEKKRMLVSVPTQYIGSTYALLKEYKEKEDWKDDGSLQIIISLPSGMQMSFYDKLNGITHGAAVVEELK